MIGDERKSTLLLLVQLVRYHIDNGIVYAHVQAGHSHQLLTSTVCTAKTAHTCAHAYTQPSCVHTVRQCMCSLNISMICLRYGGCCATALLFIEQNIIIISLPRVLINE